MSDVLNQWASQTKTAEQGGFTPHPLGDFPGVIVSIKAKTLEKTGTPVWNIQVKTAHGSAQYTIWGFSRADIEKANTHQEDRDKTLASMARYKRLYVDLGLWSKDEADSAGWDGMGHSIVGAMRHLTGKQCMLHVAPSANDPKKQVVYINAPQQNQNTQASQALPGNPPAESVDRQAQANSMAAPPFPDDQMAPSPLAPPATY